MQVIGFIFFLNLSFKCPPQATCVQYRLVVRDVSTLQILQLYTCLDQISHMDWSSDSLFVLCAMYKRGLVQVGEKTKVVIRVILMGLKTANLILVIVLLFINCFCLYLEKPFYIDYLL